MRENSSSVDYATNYREIYQQRLLESDCEALSNSALGAAGESTRPSELVEVWAMIGAKCAATPVSQELSNKYPVYSHLMELPLKDLMKSMALEEACRSWSGECEDFVLLLERLYQTADVQEQQLIISVLPLLKSPARFLYIATEAARTNIVPVFSALALNNPFPQEHFSENQWNQMVLKTIFVGCNIAQIVGLHERHNSALSETIFQYVRERHSAHRSVPSAVVELCERQLTESCQLQLNTIKPDLRKE